MNKVYEQYMNNSQLREQAIEHLIKDDYHFTRIDNQTITVFFSSDGNGSHVITQESIEEYLTHNGFRLYDSGFDNVCGKAFSLFKHLKAA